MRHLRQGSQEDDLLGRGILIPDHIASGRKHERFVIPTAISNLWIWCFDLQGSLHFSQIFNEKKEDRRQAAKPVCGIKE